MKTIRILGKEKKILPAESIVLLEANINYTRIHFEDGSQFLSSTNLGAYEEKFPHFLRINKSILINKSYVISVENGLSLHLKNGFSVIPSRRRKSQIINKLNDFLNLSCP